ncbi:NACHT domain-containing protein [Candidatus Marithrix sp. Canyon 246]|uniref:NACHT domain-containing protein n=1 Tax=Candidatus Marithrix sp. Canyon 246 TaxID=1827136 RepID=UPI00084A127E|nr:NACHT domain-containing protein [Candidatus Marithrix sp. Canyon 246]
MKLQVFGKLRLVNGNDKAYTAQLGLLIATYIVMEHQGKIDREYLCDIFYPMKPTCPDNFNTISKQIYEELWRYSISARYNKEKPYSINHHDVSDNLESAHEQLKDYDVIKNATLINNTWNYKLSDKFDNYLYNLRNFDENECKIKTIKKVSENISNIRKFIPPDKIDEMLPTGKRGKANEFFIINLPINVTDLENALAEEDIKTIKTVYTGEFLLDIEGSRTWLAPRLRCWIQEKCQDFDKKVREILEDDERKSCNSITSNTFLPYFDFTDNTVRRSSIVNVITNNYQYPDNKVRENSHNLPPHLRQHLLNKMNEECDSIQLQNQWINTQVSIKILKYDSEKTVAILDHQFFTAFFEQSYGFMILLGEAGMGKTIALSNIAQELIDKAKNNIQKPVPIILYLADWDTRFASFEDWLKHELILVGLPENNIEADFKLLVHGKTCVFLLDGFDNLPPQQRMDRLASINSFIHKYGESELGGILITSRPDEYQFAKDLLNNNINFRFYTEATIKALTSEFSHNYLNNHHIDYPVDDKFKQIIETPLGLNLLVETNNISENNLISTYINLRFDKMKQPPYQKEQVKKWLSNIANSITIGKTFNVEVLPVKMLNEKQQQTYQWWFTCLFGIVFGAMMGSIGGLIFGKRFANQVIDNNDVILPDALMGIHYTLTQWINHDLLFSKIALVISYASIGILCSLFMSVITLLLSKPFSFPIFLSGYLALFSGITGWLVDGGQWSFFVIILYGSLGILVGIMVDPVHTDPLEITLGKEIRLNYKQILKKALSALLFIPVTILMMIGFHLLIPKLTIEMALLQGFIIGTSLNLAYIFYLSKKSEDWKTHIFLPSHKIKASLQRSALMTLVIAGIITLFVTGLSASTLGWWGALSLGLRIGMTLGIIFGFMFYGGVEVLKHVTLRWFMYHQGIAPKDYIDFLEYSKKLMIMKSQSGGYAFRHDLFQEYFKAKN